MRNARFLLPVPFLVAIGCFFTGTHFTSCNKTTTTHDTAVAKTDTLITLDTLHDINSGLVAYYNFNNGSLNDSSGFGNNISFNNATPTTDRNGIANNAYLFDGATTYMSVPNSLSLNPNMITLYAIIRINGFSTESCHGNSLLYKGGGGDAVNGIYILRFSDVNGCNSSTVDTTKEFIYGDYGDNSNAGSLVAFGDTYENYIHTGTWYKVAFTFDGNWAKMYINGQLVGSVAKTDSFTPNTSPLLIGKIISPAQGGEDWFNGVVDEVRIYNRALTTSEIQVLGSQTE